MQKGHKLSSHGGGGGGGGGRQRNRNARNAGAKTEKALYPQRREIEKEVHIRLELDA